MTSLRARLVAACALVGALFWTSLGSAAVQGKDRLLAAIAVLEDPVTGAGRGEHLWVAMPIPPRPPSEAARASVGRPVSNATVVLVHGPAQAPGIMNVVAEHATMPEAIAAHDDRVYLVFRSPGFDRRDVLLRRVEWNEATQRSFALPAQGELLPSLPLDGDLLGFSADQHGVWALLVRSPAVRLGIRREGASGSEAGEPLLLRLDRQGWSPVAIPAVDPSRGASDASLALPITLVDDPRGVRVLVRDRERLVLIDPVDGGRTTLTQPIGGASLDALLARRPQWFGGSVRGELPEDAGRDGRGFVGCADWPLERDETEDGRPVRPTHPPNGRRSELRLRWAPTGAGDGLLGGDAPVEVKNQAVGPTPRPWALLRGADDLVLVTLASPMVPPAATGGKSAAPGEAAGEERGDGSTTSAAAVQTIQAPIESLIQTARVPLTVVPPGASVAAATPPASVALERSAPTGFGAAAWIHIPLILMVGMAALMVVAFVRVVRMPEGGDRAIELPILPMGRRVAALVIDLAIPVLLAWAVIGAWPRPLVLLTSWLTDVEQGVASLAAIGATLLHTGLTEWLLGTTLGKRLVGGAVVSTTASDPVQATDPPRDPARDPGGGRTIDEGSGRRAERGNPSPGDARGLRFGQAVTRAAFKGLVLAAPILGVFTILSRDGRGMGDVASGTAVIRRGGAETTPR